MSRTIQDLAIITLFIILSTIIMWLPHYLELRNLFGLNFRQGFSTIYQNYDGLEYVAIAKTWYNPTDLGALPGSLSSNYYAAHFPGYPIFISLFAPFLGYLKSMLAVSLLFTIGSAFIFYFLVKDFQLTHKPLFLTLVFLVLPARWIIVRSVGTPEPVFIFFILAATYYLMKAKYIKFSATYIWMAALFAAIAQFVRPPGNLFAITVFLYALWDSFNSLREHGFRQRIYHFLQYYPFLLVPITLSGVFLLFHFTLTDFWAYFNSGDNIHLTFPPFAVFNQSQYWVGSIWLEDIVYIFLIGFVGGVFLLRNKLPLMGIFVLVYLTASVFVAHRDISRYTLPIAPFVIIAFEKVLTSKEFQVVLIILSLGIYLYAQNFILANTAPIPNLPLYD